MSAEMILYNTDDGRTVVQLKAQDGSAWLSQAQIAELFEVTPQAVTQHVRAIYEDGELDEGATCKAFLQVRNEGNREVSRQIAHYSLPMILAVGFRVRSPRGAQFRRWASTTLSEYLVKGFAMDDARLKDPDGDYFDELLARNLPTPGNSKRVVVVLPRRISQKILYVCNGFMVCLTCGSNLPDRARHCRKPREGLAAQRERD